MSSLDFTHPTLSVSSQQLAYIPSTTKPSRLKMGMTEPSDSEYSPTLRSRLNRKREQWVLCLKAGWEELSVTLIKGSSSVSIESVQKSAEQVEGGGRERAAGHEVERNDGEDNPGITLGWDGGDREGGITEPTQGPLALHFVPESRAALTDEVRHKQEDIFVWHRGGPLAAPGPIRRCQLSYSPATRPHSPARRIGRANCAQNPAALARSQMLKLTTGRSMGRLR